MNLIREREREREQRNLKSNLNSANAKDLGDSNATNLLDSAQNALDLTFSTFSTTQTSLQNYKKLDYESLSDDEKKEGYVFHILSDFVSEDSRQKLNNLAKELSQIYPCEIIIHIANDEIFKGLPKLNNNYLTYFRFFIPNFIPQSTRICLYLDVDMLVLKDLRELFALDLEDKILGVVKEWMEIVHYIHKSYGTKLCIKGGRFEKFYFNAGLLLINLTQWHKQDTTKQCLDFFINYKDKIIMHDQDALNYVVSQDKAMVLPFEFNVFIDRIKSDYNDFLPDYNDDEIEYALQNIVIYHFKPWTGFDRDCINSWIDRIKWWEIAFQTPFFKDELKALFATKRDNYLVCKDFGLYIASLINEHSKNLLGYLKMPFVVWRAFKAFDLSKNYANNFSESLDKNMAFELLNVAVRAWGKKHILERIAKFIILPFRIHRTKNRCKKGIYKAQKGNVISRLYVD